MHVTIHVACFAKMSALSPGADPGFVEGGGIGCEPVLLVPDREEPILPNKLKSEGGGRSTHTTVHCTIDPHGTQQAEERGGGLRTTGTPVHVTIKP